MTSEEIRSTKPNRDEFWLKEIALQLALFNEHLVLADAAVFGTPGRPTWEKYIGPVKGRDK